MLKDWFDASEVCQFGKGLAESFAEKYPDLEKKKDVYKRAKVIGKLNSEVKQFAQSHSLNFYKKAQLGNAFKWALIEKGFENEFVDELTKEVILALK